MKKISKVLEIENCPADDLLQAIYIPEFWEAISPVSEIHVENTAPNVIFSQITDHIKYINFPLEMEGELVMVDKGREKGKGNLVEFNVRNNKDVRKLEGRLRIKALGHDKSKVGIFIVHFLLENSFLEMLGRDVAEMILRTKVSGLLRGVEQFCRDGNLKELTID
ncbi:MAG: hypothetical protein ACOC44_04085 [Promethearchaeia archaeon]